MTQMFSTDFSISGTNDVLGRINVVRAAVGRTRIVRAKPAGVQWIVIELLATTSHTA